MVKPARQPPEKPPVASPKRTHAPSSKRGTAGRAADVRRHADRAEPLVPPPDASAAITLDQLQVFVAIADRGGFSAAARSLRRAQSAVSYAVSNLERQLALELFDRTTRRPTLTPAGVALLADTRAALREVGALVARARSVSEGLEPRLAIAVSVMFPMADLAAALREFRERFPTVALVLHTEALGGVAQLVLDGVASIGISEPLPKMSPLLSHEALGSVPFAHVAAATHPLARKRGVVDVTELERHVQLVLSDRSRLTEGMDFGVGSGPNWRVSDLAAKHALILAGLGWGGMPRWAVADDLERGALVLVRPDPILQMLSQIPLFAIHRTTIRPGPGAQWLIRRLKLGCPGR